MDSSFAKWKCLKRHSRDLRRDFAIEPATRRARSARSLRLQWDTPLRLGQNARACQIFSIRGNLWSQAVRIWFIVPSGKLSCKIDLSLPFQWKCSWQHYGDGLELWTPTHEQPTAVNFVAYRSPRSIRRDVSGTSQKVLKVANVLELFTLWLTWSVLYQDSG